MINELIMNEAGLIKFLLFYRESFEKLKSFVW